jgi:hypothetical protein
MNTTGITKEQNTFKGFYRGKVHVSRVYCSLEGFSFSSSPIFMSFHNLATGEILQTKPMRSYLQKEQLNANKVDVNLLFNATGYFILEFHGIKEGEEIGFMASF